MFTFNCYLPAPAAMPCGHLALLLGWIVKPGQQTVKGICLILDNANALRFVIICRSVDDMELRSTFEYGRDNE